MAKPCAECNLGIVFALRAEERGFRHVLAQSRLHAARDESHHRWRVGSVCLSVEIAGIGRRNCAAATDRLIAGGARWIVCAGFAGALNEDLKVGDVIIADTVLSEGGEPIGCSRGLLEAVPPSGTLGYSIYTGKLLTVDHIVTTAGEKSHIRARTEAHAIDMESYAAAEVCRRRGVPFLAIRSITDTAHEDLCPSVGVLASGLRPIAKAAHVLTRPLDWPALLRLRKNAALAANNLGDVLGVMLLRII